MEQAKIPVRKVKAKSFFFHYNKPESKKAGKPKLTLHFNQCCFLVDHIICSVPIRTKHNKRQPYCVMTGKLNNIEVTAKRENNVTVEMVATIA